MLPNRRFPLKTICCTRTTVFCDEVFLVLDGRMVVTPSLAFVVNKLTLPDNLLGVFICAAVELHGMPAIPLILIETGNPSPLSASGRIDTPERAQTSVRKQNPAKPQPFSAWTIWRRRCVIHAQHAGKSIPAAKFRMDDIAVCPQRFAQHRDLKLEITFRHDDARPDPAHELLFGDERAVGLQQDQQEIEGARAEIDGNALGEQLPAAQQDTETAEFESLAGVCQVRGVSALPNRGSASNRL
jgi:hypothetical protein